VVGTATGAVRMPASLCHVVPRTGLLH
jgi:hypothetical protein